MTAFRKTYLGIIAPGLSTVMLGFSACQSVRTPPEPDFVTISPHPNLAWEARGDFMAYDVEIAQDPAFSTVVDRDVITHIARYVPAIPLDPGTYYWRVTCEQGGVQRGAFTVQAPSVELQIPAGSGMEDIRAALAQAAHHESTLIQFEPGEYHLHPGTDGTVFEVHDLAQVILDGSGATFVIHDVARLADVRGSRHITFRNFDVDYEVPIHTAARVDSVAPDGTLELTLWPGCAPPESVPRFMEEKRGLFYEPEFPRMAENVPLLVYMREAWEPLGNDRYRLQAVRPEEVQQVQPGMVYICAPRYVPQGIELYTSDDITFADITTYYLPGIGVVTAFAEELKLIRLNMLRREDRLLAVQNGGTNLHNARIGPWVEDCHFENTGDDCNHISALVLSPVAQPEPDVVVISPQQAGTRGLTAHDLDVQVGDTLAFFDRPSGTLLEEARVVRSEVTGRDLTVQVDRPLPELTVHPGLDGFPPLEVVQIYNLDRACGNFAFRHNTFLRGRRTGILAKSGPGLIEHNRLEELGGGGVEIFNAPLEGLHGHDILIQHNHFARGGIVYKRMGSAPAIWTEIFSGDSPQALHRNIWIRHNHIEDYPGHALHLQDAVDVRVEHNTFVNRELQTLRDEGAQLIYQSNAKIQIGENDNRDTRYDVSSPADLTSTLPLNSFVSCCFSRWRLRDQVSRSSSGSRLSE